MITHPNCKINLGLHVVRKRPDGYHDLETVFLPVAIRDRLEIVPSPHFSFSQDGLTLDSSDADNMVIRAYRLISDYVPGLVGNVNIRLTKIIPFGAGLGGGSSDAAFTLSMLNSLFDLRLDNATLRLLAAQLGADCPFFIDNKPAYATGIGDQLSLLPFNPVEGFKMVLIKPDEAVSTAEAYRGITPRGDNGSVDLRQALRLPVSQWRETVVNDFETTVFQSHPKLRQIKDDLYHAGALYASMTGSGSTLFGLFKPESDTSSLTRRYDGSNGSTTLSAKSSTNLSNYKTFTIL